MILRKKYMRKQAGFTLFETLITMLILLMVTSIVTAGIPVATRAYQKVTRTANAQVALSTTISALQDELGTAKNIECESPAIEYYSSRTCNSSRITIEGNEITIEEYLDAAASVKTGYDVKRPLISKAMVGKDVYVTYKSVSYSAANSLISFTKLGAYPVGKDATTANAVVELPELKIRVIAP